MNINETLNTSSSKENNNQKDEEEETLVVLQFTDPDDANYCQQFSNKFKSLDISAKSPIIQIGNRLYTGEYTNSIGTYLFFEETWTGNLPPPPPTTSTNTTTSEISESSETSTNSCYNYSGKTYKKLVLSRLFVEPKSSTTSE